MVTGRDIETTGWGWRSLRARGAYSIGRPSICRALGLSHQILLVEEEEEVRRPCTLRAVTD